MSVQQHVIAGFVGSAPETREVNTANGPRTVTTMSVAVNNNRNRESAPTWYRVTMWNGLGKTVEQYVEKGDYVVVVGERLTVSVWTDRDDKPRATLELTANSVDFSANRRGASDSEPESDTPGNDMDIPF